MLAGNALRDDCYLPERKNTDEADLARTAKITASSAAEGFAPEAVVNGIFRAVDGAENAWRSAPIAVETPEWLSLLLEKPSEVRVFEVRIY